VIIRSFGAKTVHAEIHIIIPKTLDGKLHFMNRYLFASEGMNCSIRQAIEDLL